MGRRSIGLCLLLGGGACVPSPNLDLPGPDGEPCRLSVLALVEAGEASLFAFPRTRTEELTLALPSSAEAYLLCYELFSLPSGAVVLAREGENGEPLPAPDALYKLWTEGSELSWREEEAMPPSIGRVRLPSEDVEPGCPVIVPSATDVGPIAIAAPVGDGQRALVARSDGSLLLLGLDGETEIHGPQTDHELSAGFVFDQGRRAWLGGMGGELVEVDLERGSFVRTATTVFRISGAVVALAGAEDGTESFAVNRRGEMARFSPETGWVLLAGSRQAETQFRRSLLWLGPGHVLEAAGAPFLRRVRDGVISEEWPSPVPEARIEAFTTLVFSSASELAIANVNMVSTTAIYRDLFRHDPGSGSWRYLDRTAESFNSIVSALGDERGFWYGTTGGWAGRYVPSATECGSIRIEEENLDFLFPAGELVGATGRDLSRVYWLGLD